MKISRKYKILGLVSLLVAAVICFSACASASGAQGANAKDANGEHGENIVWSYTAKTKTLSITGKGDMAAIAASKDVPWASVRQSAEKIIIENGILSISDYAFYGFDALTSVELPESVGSVGKLSFAFCTSLTSVKLPSNLTSIGDNAFEWCASLKSINVGERLSTLGKRCFAYCGALESAYLCSEGIAIGDETFKSCTSLKTLAVHPTISADKVSANAFVGASIDFSSAVIQEKATETVTIAVNYYIEGATETVYENAKVFGIGEAYEIVTPEREGYLPDKAVISGVAEKDEVFTVIYKQIVPETEPESESESEAAPVEDEKSPLSNIIAIVVLVLVLAGIGVGAYFLKRSNKAEENKQKNQNKAKNKKQK